MNNKIKLFGALLLGVSGMAMSPTNMRILDIDAFYVNEEADGIRVYASYKVDHYERMGMGAEVVIKNRDGEGENRVAFISTSAGFTTSGVLIDKVISTDKFFENNVITYTLATNKEGSVSYSITFNRFGVKELELEERNNHTPITQGYYQNGYLNGSKISYTYADYFSFANYYDNVVEPVYNHFDIRAIKFKYINGKDDVLHGEYRFDFYDAFNLFKTFPMREETMYRSIPLNIVKDEDDYYHFEFAVPLYYQPTTHEASMVEQDGYLATNLLYLPKKYADQLDDIDCELIMNIHSYRDYLIHGRFTLRYLKKQFGDCFDSEYCIERNIDYGENVKEHVQEIYL